MVVRIRGQESGQFVNWTDSSSFVTGEGKDSVLFSLGLSPGLWDNFVGKGGNLQREMLDFLLLI